MVVVVVVVVVVVGIATHWFLAKLLFLLQAETFLTERFLEEPPGYYCRATQQSTLNGLTLHANIPHCVAQNFHEFHDSVNLTHREKPLRVGRDSGFLDFQHARSATSRPPASS